jgi:alcohol dehydrogenase class IV
LADINQKLECKNPLIITDSFLGKTNLPEHVREVLPNVNLFCDLQADPKDGHVEKALKAVKESQADMLITIGGGSATGTDA